MAERRIRELQDTARTMLIHANRRWPGAIETFLWPYALRMANDQVNNTPSLTRKDHATPMSLFADTIVAINPLHWRHFGCPAYELDKVLQTGRKIGKWDERSRVGIYLGNSTQHARSVGLVLNLTTGLCSPAYHVVFDPSFETMRRSFGNYPPVSKWQEVCRFRKSGTPTAPVQPAKVRAPRRTPLDQPPTPLHPDPVFAQEGEDNYIGDDGQDDPTDQQDPDGHQTGPDGVEPEEEPPPPEPPPENQPAVTTRCTMPN